MNMREKSLPQITRRQLLVLAGAPAAIALAPMAMAATRPLSDASFRRIGGIEQWIEIRGRDRSWPPILFLHGGPGEAQSPFASMFTEWEKRYVVAQWDQRGAGKTFGRNGAVTPDMTLEQMAQDAIEVTRDVLRRLRKRKLILVGHSWGALLGMSVVRLQPKLFDAFVATGQPISGRSIIEGMRASAIVRARAAGDTQAVEELQRLTSIDYSDMNKLGIVFRWAEPFPESDMGYLAAQVAMLRTPGQALSAASNDWFGGRQFSLSKLMQYILGFDARAAGLELPVPYFVIQGRGDTRTPTDAAKSFVDEVNAPNKGFTAIEGAHFACFTNSAEFLAALDRDLRLLGAA
jgi:pimeloyl-ACP methyl ester carboxylesterase